MYNSVGRALQAKIHAMRTEVLQECPCFHLQNVGGNGNAINLLSCSIAKDILHGCRLLFPISLSSGQDVILLLLTSQFFNY